MSADRAWIVGLDRDHVAEVKRRGYACNCKICGAAWSLDRALPVRPHFAAALPYPPALLIR